MKKIVLAGATGLIGSQIALRAAKSGYDISIISRDPHSAIRDIPFAKGFFGWQQDSIRSAIERATAVINLSGAPIAARKWTPEYKNIILGSRIGSTNSIVEAIINSDNPPKTFINASAIGYYGNNGDNILDEDSPNGKDFLSNVCVQWENAAMRAASTTRVITPRIGVVLSHKGGALEKMLLPFKYFAGGTFGSGKQWMSWIHIDDVVGLFLHSVENINIKGAINLFRQTP